MDITAHFNCLKMAIVWSTPPHLSPQNPQPFNNKNLLSMTKVFCWCSLIYFICKEIKQVTSQSVIDNASSVIWNIKLHSVKNQLEFESRFFIIHSNVSHQCRAKICKDDLRSKQFLWITIISVYRSNDFNWNSWHFKS